MDALLRDMLTTTVTLREVTESDSGVETADAAVVVAAYVEAKSIYEPAPEGGGQRVTRHFVTVEVAVTETMRVWLAGEDADTPSLGKRPKQLNPFFDPDTRALDHTEFYV